MTILNGHRRAFAFLSDRPSKVLLWLANYDNEMSKGMFVVAAVDEESVRRQVTDYIGHTVELKISELIADNERIVDALEVTI